jgi:sugar phosphate isomerase/epimerase
LIEQFGIAASSLPALTFEQDLDVLVAAEVGGIGIDESTLGTGPDAERLAQFFESGLRATSAVPSLQSFFPAVGPSSAVTDAYLAERLSRMCSSVRRLAAFDPVAIKVQTGPLCGWRLEEFLAQVVHGLRMLARTATKLHPRPLQIALEPVAPEWAVHGWAVTSLSDAAQLIDAAGEPNVRIVLDTWHQADVAMEQIARFANRVVLVELAERTQGVPYPAGSASPERRAMRADGSACAAIVRSLFEAGYRGWYEMEAPVGSNPDSVKAALAQARSAFREFHRTMVGL